MSDSPHERTRGADSEGVTHIQVDESQRAGITGRWVQVGHSDDVDSFRAGVIAASTAMDAVDAVLFLVFAGGHHDHEQLMAGVASVAPAGSAAVGCTTDGARAGGDGADNGVCVMAIGGDGISVATRRVDIAGRSPLEAGEEAASVIRDIDGRGHTVVLLFAGGAAADQYDVVRGARAALDAEAPLIGGCVGDVEISGTALFHATSDATRIGPDQLIGIAISSVGPIGIGADGGCQPDDVDATGPVGRAIGGADDPGASTVAAYRQAVSTLNGSPVGVLVFGEAVLRVEERSDTPVIGCALHRQFARVEGAAAVHDPAVIALAIG